MNGLVSKDDIFLKKVLQNIEDNLGNDQYSVEHLAQNVGLSRSMLHRRLTKLSSKSASELITGARLSRAKELLGNDNLSVAEIAYRVGFKNPSYFNKVFKQHNNISPGEFRSNYSGRINTSIKQTENTAKKQRKANHKYVTVIALLLTTIITTIILYSTITSINPKEKSIAILPLHNLTGQSDNDYFVDGIHDALIGELGSIASIRVISRTSTLRYRNSELPLKDIAKELGVKSILEGSVLSFGDSLRMLIQLIDVFPQERHLFANEYYTDLSEVLTVQSSIIDDIANKIKLRLTSKEQAHLKQSNTIDPETYKAYLRGMYFLNQGTKESFERGMEHLHQAIERDPGNPFAYAAMALGYATMGHGQLNSEDAFLLALSSAEKAIKIDPSIDEAYNALSILYLYSFWDWPKAKQAFENTLKNNPNNAIAHAHFAWYYILFDDMKRCLYHAEKAALLEPFSASYSVWLAMLYFHNKEYEKAELWANKGLKLNENVPYGNLCLAWIRIHNKQYPEAIDFIEKLPEKGMYWNTLRGFAYVKVGQREKALEIWNEWKELSKTQQSNPCYGGMMAAYLGFTNQAFALLNQAIDKKSYPVTYINFYPCTEDIRHDERYIHLLQRMKLPCNKTQITTK